MGPCVAYAWASRNYPGVMKRIIVYPVPPAMVLFSRAPG